MSISFSVSAGGGACSKSARADKQSCHRWNYTPTCHMQFNTTLEALGLWSAVCSRDGQPNCLVLQVLLEIFHVYVTFWPCLVLPLKVKDSVWPSEPKWSDGKRSIDCLIAQKGGSALKLRGFYISRRKQCFILWWARALKAVSLQKGTDWTMSHSESSMILL